MFSDGTFWTMFSLLVSLTGVKRELAGLISIQEAF
jgi:hypothetical protein